MDFSSVFYFNFVVCLALYAIMFMAAPIIANFYKDLSLTPIIRVISLTIVISGVKGIQQSYVSRNMLFKRFFYATLGGTVFSAFLGIGLAYAGFGVWAIVAQQLSNTAIDTLILWLTVKWRPKKMFSWERLKGLLSFGWKMLASALLDTLYGNIRSLIIGKMYSSADLAYYNQGDKFPNVIASNINTSIDSVLLPTMAGVQDDSSRVKAMTRRAIKTSTYIMAPLMMGLAFCAEPIVRLVLTDKWLQCVPFLRIFCITYMFYPIHTANLNAIKAMGRSDLFLKLEIAKKIVGKDDSWVQLLNDQKNFGIHGPESVCFVGGNAKMNEFQAAMGICNLRHLDEEIAKRKKVVERYRERLSGVEGIKLSAIQENVESNYAYFPVVFDGYKYTRNEIYEMLQEQGITARKYFYPLTNSFECYRNYPTAGTEKTPVAQHLALRVLTLPLYADLSLEDVNRICDVILGQKD